MILRDWLSQEKGRHKALAQELRLSPGRITQMAQTGVPAKYMLAVRDFTHGGVTLEEMVEERSGVKVPAHMLSPSAEPEKTANG